MKILFKTSLFVVVLLSNFAFAQNPDYTQLDPKPYNPETEPDIDLFISSWKDHEPRNTYGSLIEHDIFTKSAGDPLNPHKKGAVLTYLNRFTHGSLEAGASTNPTKLSGEQIVFFFDSGKGIIEAGKTADVSDGVGVIMPPDIIFTIKNTGNEPLTMYIMAEPIPEGFKQKKEMVVKDTNIEPIVNTTGHWCHIFRRLFNQNDGTALLDMGPVWYDPMTMGQPHSHNPGFEEIWFALEGDINILLGKKMRKLPVGSAYKVPPDYKSPHSNINVSDKPVKLLWFIIRTVPEPLPPSYSMLDSRPYDPETDPHIDMYIRSWKESMPMCTHGCLIERDVLTKCDGDPLNPIARGAVLKYVNRFTHATLMGYNTTKPTILKGEQELFYILSGKGTVTGGGKTHNLFPGIAFLIPENLEFTMKNTGEESMEMYLVAEPTPEDFRPNDYIVVRNENIEPIHTRTAHWVNSNKWLIKAEEGLAKLGLVLTVEIPPGTFAQPHSHGRGTEEVWCPITDSTKVLLGKQIRNLPSGTAYMIPPNGTTPHANFNVTDKPIKIFYFSLSENQ